MSKKSYFPALFGVLVLGIFIGSQVPVVPWFFLLVGGLGFWWLYLEYGGHGFAKIMFWFVTAGIGIAIGQAAEPSMVWDQPTPLELEGIVTQVTDLSYDTRVVVKLPSSSKVAVHLPLDVHIGVGDHLAFRGIVSTPPQAPNPGVFCYRTYLARNNVYGLCYPTEYTVTKNETKPSLLVRLQHRMKDNIQRHVEQPGLVLALVLGDRSGIDKEQEANWSKLGISHLLAISGMHVGLVAFLVSWFVNRLPLRPLLKALVTQFILLVYIVLSGNSTSAKRALFMFVFGGVASLRGVSLDPLQIWAAVGCGLLLVSPRLLFSQSFVLSFLASGGILLWGPSIRFRGKKGLNFILSSLAVSCIAQISAAPVLLYSFGELPLFGPLSTLLFLPLVFLLILGGFAVACGLGSLGFGYLVNMTNGIVGFLEHLLVPKAVVWRPQRFIWLDLLVWWCLFIYGGWLLRRPRVTRPRQSLRHLCVCTAAVLCFTSLPPSLKSPLEVTAVNVGQGDCYYIRTPYGQHILVDGGGDSVYWQARGRNVGEQRLLPYLRHRGVDRLDMIILSHPHEDHLFGLLAVLENMDVGVVLDNGHLHTTPSYERYLELIQEKGIKHISVRAGYSMELTGGIKLTFLHPYELLENTGSDYNNNSLVFMLKYQGVRMLFTGDLEKIGQWDLLHREEEALSADWIKVPHHGSRTGWHEPFYEAVNPRWACISVGPNSFGHPHQEVLDNLDSRGIRWATTLNGPQTYYVWFGILRRFSGTWH